MDRGGAIEKGGAGWGGERGTGIAHSGARRRCVAALCPHPRRLRDERVGRRGQNYCRQRRAPLAGARGTPPHRQPPPGAGAQVPSTARGGRHRGGGGNKTMSASLLVKIPFGGARPPATTLMRVAVARRPFPTAWIRVGFPIWAPVHFCTYIIYAHAPRRGARSRGSWECPAGMHGWARALPPRRHRRV